MNTYFDRFERSMCDVVERRMNRRWYARLLGTSRTRTLVVVVAALVVATPAFGAVSGWFSVGKPNVPPPAKAGYMFGLARPGSSRLLSLRVPDPDGGPPWGLRLVKTSRDDTCVQLGRVADGQLGSLGIDDAWHNDHQFHAISPKDDPIDQCGSTDAVGYGYVNRGILGEQASANPTPFLSGCQLPHYLSLMGLRRPPHVRTHVSTTPGCPADAGRVVFLGLLGPDAISVTYQKPGGGIATERTSGDVGAYLLVFPYNEATCYQYSHSAHRAVSCDGISEGGVSPTQPGAITKITYRDGHSCSLNPPAKLDAAFKAFQHEVAAKLGRPPRGKPQATTGTATINRKWLAAYRALLTKFLTREHLTVAQFRQEFGPLASCPAVGWVSSKGPKVTAGEVATPIVVREFPTGKYGCPNKLHLPQGCDGINPDAPTPVVPIEWSFKARKAVTNSRSWYEWSVWPASAQTGTNCGGSSFATYNNIRQGQTLRYSEFLPTYCHGTYSIIVGFMSAAPPGQTDDDNASGGTPGHDGSLIVGHATFTIR